MSYGGGHDGQGCCTNLRIVRNGHHHGYGGGQGQWHHDGDGQHHAQDGHGGEHHNGNGQHDVDGHHDFDGHHVGFFRLPPPMPAVASLLCANLFPALLVGGRNQSIQERPEVLFQFPCGLEKPGKRHIGVALQESVGPSLAVL